MAEAEPVAGSGFRFAVCELLQIDLGAGFFKLSLELFRVGLVHALLHRLRRAFHQVLGFLEAQARDGAHFLDDFDLLVAGGGELDRKLGLLFGRSGRGSANAFRPGSFAATAANGRRT